MRALHASPGIALAAPPPRLPQLSFPSGSTVAQANSISNDAVNPRRPSARIVGVAVPSYRRAQFVGFLSPPQGEALPSGKPRSWRLLPSDRRIPACFVDVVPAECQKVAKDGAEASLFLSGSACTSVREAHPIWGRVCPLWRPQ